MVFSRDLTSLVKIVFMLATLVALWGVRDIGVIALKCHQCGWDSCGTNEELVECTLERVNQVHGHLQRLVNLSQYQELQMPSEFVCFELRLTNMHGNRSGTVKSCTLQATKMCYLNDWQTVKVVGCKTCNDRDYCNGFEISEPRRDDSGVGFSFSSSRRSVASGSTMPNIWGMSGSLWNYAKMGTLAFLVHKQLAKRF